MTNKLRKNPFIVSTLVCGTLAVLLLIIMVSGGGSITGKVVSEEDIGSLALDFANNELLSNPGEIISVEEISGMYKILFSINSEEVPLYFTKDGKWIGQGGELVPITEQISLDSESSNSRESQDIPKSDKPEVELFIWSYCPYGVLAQGPLAEVASFLAGKANFKAIMYYDGHGDYETQQNKIQACIQEKDNDNYWAYASGFVDDIYPACSQSRDIECDKTESIKLMNSLGIDSEGIMSCVESEGADLIKADSEYAQSLGVTGSPTVIVNGVKVNVARNAEAYKGAVCEAFSNAPEECGTVLNSETAAASGSC